MLNESEVIAAIRAWHEADRCAGLTRTFALGDLLLRACIHTGLSESEIIRRVMEDLGELSLGQTSYNRAARMARVFTKGQRAVLIAHAVSIDRAEILAGAYYDQDRRRIKVISDIKAGKLVAPWSCIRGAREIQGRRRHPALQARSAMPSDAAANPDNVIVRVVGSDGEIDEDQVVLIFKNLFTRIGHDRAVRLWSRALREAGASPTAGR